jgi:hypothetical protein
MSPFLTEALKCKHSCSRQVCILRSIPTNLILRTENTEKILYKALFKGCVSKRRQDTEVGCFFNVHWQIHEAVAFKLKQECFLSVVQS